MEYTIKDDVDDAMDGSGVAGHVLLTRLGSDGGSAVVVVETDYVGPVQNALASLGWSVSVEDSQNPAVSSLRVRR